MQGIEPVHEQPESREVLFGDEEAAEEALDGVDQTAEDYIRRRAKAYCYVIDKIQVTEQYITAQ